MTFRRRNHPQAKPVILTAEEKREKWLRASGVEVKLIEWPPDGVLRIVNGVERMDAEVA